MISTIHNLADLSGIAAHHLPAAGVEVFSVPHQQLVTAQLLHRMLLLHALKLLAACLLGLIAKLCIVSRTDQLLKIFLIHI